MKFIFAALLLLISSMAFAAQVYVEPTTGSGVAAADLQSTTELIQNSVANVSKNTVATAPDQADFVLRPHLMRLGAAYILSLSKVQGGQVVYSSDLKAEHIEELDKVADRLTRSVLTGERASEHPRVGEITDQEAHDGTQRRPTRTVGYLGFGGVEFSNLNSSSAGISIAGGYGWDLNTVLLKIMAEGDFQGSAWIIGGALGGNYYLVPTDVAPYISADFGGGVSKIREGVFDGQVVGGFIVGVGAGVSFFRTSAVNLDLAFRAGFLLHENDLGTPAAYTLRLGLYF
jgi:hypothetical protein